MPLAHHGFVIAGLVALALAAPACAATDRGGIREFDQARYPEALDDLRRSEGEVPSWGVREQTRYALYRGLTHLALGDRSATYRWLHAAKRAVDGCPSLLSDEDAGRLAAAWSHLQVELEPAQ